MAQCRRGDEYDIDSVNNIIGSFSLIRSVWTVVPVVWQPTDSATKSEQTSLLTNSYMASLRRLAPDTGTYLNEADPNEPDLPEAYWGTNYLRLLGLKRKYDPQGVFWCAPCVGSQDWQLVDGRLCRT